jgi:hypothetical protein
MTMTRPAPRLTPGRLALALLPLALVACGGGDPPDVQNPAGTGSNKLAFAYFQRCIMPALSSPIAAPHGGGTNTCSSGGCHANANGTGGALRLVEAAGLVDLKDPANTADQIRGTDMYKNYYSALGATVAGNPEQSRLLLKPLLQGVLHGGGQILVDDQDPVAKLISYWIAHPVPQSGDEFSASTYNMFTPADPQTGSCNTTP